MFCVTCQADVSECKCPDLETRLNALTQQENLIIVTWCVECNKPQAACEHKDDEIVHYKTGGNVIRKLDMISPI